MKKLSKKLEQVETSGIRRMFELAKTLKNPTDLSLGMPDTPVPSSVKEALISEIEQGRPGYSSSAGSLEAREAVAQKLREQNGIKASAEEVIITSGTTGGLSLALMSLLEEGDEVILIDPYFVLYKQIISFIGATPVFVSSYPDWRLPVDGIAKALSPKTKAVVINSPNNPTGAVYSRKELSELAEVLRSSEVVAVSDEIYEKYTYGDNVHVSMASLYSSTITLGGPSKSVSMAGWRIGYLHAPREWIEDMLKVQQILYVCAPVPAQKGLVEAMKFDMKEIVSKFEERREVLLQGLSRKLKLGGLEGAFYGFIPVGDADKAVEELVKRNILVTPGKVFSEKNTHIRISYGGVGKEMLEEAVDAVRELKIAL